MRDLHNNLWLLRLSHSYTNRKEVGTAGACFESEGEKVLCGTAPMSAQKIGAVERPYMCELSMGAFLPPDCQRRVRSLNRCCNCMHVWIVIIYNYNVRPLTKLLINASGVFSIATKAFERSDEITSPMTSMRRCLFNNKT